MTAKDAVTRETVGENMDTCTANSKTTYNRVIGRRKLPFSLFNTSLQLCPSVHLRVHCKADRTSFTEEDSLYIDYEEHRRFCVRTVVNKYFTQNRTVRTCDKLKLRNIMSDIDTMAASLSQPTLHFIGPIKKCSQSSSYLKVIPHCFSPIFMFFSSWMWQLHVPLLYNILDRMLPRFCSFRTFCDYPYAEFLMACFQYTYRRDALCTRLFCRQPSMLHSCSCNSSSNSSEHEQFTSHDSSVGRYHYEAETNSVNSGMPVQINGATDLSNWASYSEVMQPRNTSGNICSNSSRHTRLLECIATVPSDVPNCTDDDDDDDDDENDAECRGDTCIYGSSLKEVSFGADSVSGTPFLTSSGIDESWSTDESDFKSSFFIHASNLDTSDDDDDDESDVVTASDDDSDCCWDDDDSCWLSPADGAQCFLVDLDPFMVNGLYIPQTSNVPVSHSRCLSLPVDLATEVESESERALKRVNDTWHRWYKDDVTMKTLSAHQCQTKHVGVFMLPA